MNKNTLIDKCKELGVKKYSNKTKSEIIELLNDYNKNNQNDNIISKTSFKPLVDKRPTGPKVSLFQLIFFPLKTK